MREGIGSVFLYNIIIIFILIVFAFLAASMSYAKAFKVNTLIVNSIEKYEGYNGLSSEQINKDLNTIGYRYDPDPKCPKRNGQDAMVFQGDVYHRYCIYKESFSYGNYDYNVYGVVTYIAIDMPIIGGLLQIPIFTATEKIYNLG